jgi:hypothetical protein
VDTMRKGVWRGIKGGVVGAKRVPKKGVQKASRWICNVMIIYKKSDGEGAGRRKRFCQAREHVQSRKLQLLVYVRNNLVRSISWLKLTNQSGPFDFTPNLLVCVSQLFGRTKLLYYVRTRNWSFTLSTVYDNKLHSMAKWNLVLFCHAELVKWWY